MALSNRTRIAPFSAATSPSKLTIAAVLLAVSTAVANAAAPTLVWKQVYDGPQAGDGNEAAQTVVRTASNDFIVGGYALDSSGKKAIVILRKYSAAGSLLWSRQHDNAFEGNSAVRGMTLDASGNVVAVAEVGVVNSPQDLYLASYSSADGSLLWDELYPNTNGAPLGAFTFDAQANIFTSRSVQNDILLTKYNSSSGTVLWEELYSPAPDADDSANALAVTETGDLLLTGRSDGEFLLARLAAADGAVQWEERIPNASGSSVAASELQVFVSGTLHSPTNNQIFVAKFSAENGDPLWQIQSTNLLGINDLAGPLFLDEVTATVTARQGPGIYVLRVDQESGAVLWERHIAGEPLHANWPINGATASNGDLYLLGLLNSNPYLARLAAADGAILWANGFHKGGISAIVPDQEDNLVFVGNVKTSPPNTVSQDFYVAKLAVEDGSLLWQDSYNTLTDIQDYGLRSTLDSQGNVIVSGKSADKYYTVKYANTDGALLWGITHSERGAGLATDAHGDVTLNRYTRNHGTLWPIQTLIAKYRGEDGEQLWEKDFGPNFLDPWSGNPVVNSSGNVIVAYNRLVGANSQIYVAQLRGSDGSVQWEIHKTGQISANAGAVAIDSANNVFIAGSLDGQQYSAKLSPIDGSVLWERTRTNEPGAVSLITAAMVDPAGNLVTSGQFGLHILTTKSRSSDGTPIWEAVRRDPHRGYPGALLWSMTIDSQGSVAIAAEERNLSPIGTIYVAKYGAADGSVIWDKNFGVGPRPTTEFPAGIFADEAGNLIVGVDAGSQPSPTFYLAKLRSADGAVMWEHKETPLQSYNFTMDAQGRIAIPGGYQDGITILLQDELPIQLKAPILNNGVLRLAWPESHDGLRLEKTPLANNFSATAAWTEVPASGETNSITIPIDLQSKSGFFRLVQP